MHYYVLTLFPEMITNACGESILGRASQKGLISVEAINIRDYSTNKHNRVDDSSKESSRRIDGTSEE